MAGLRDHMAPREPAAKRRVGAIVDSSEDEDGKRVRTSASASSGRALSAEASPSKAVHVKASPSKALHAKASPSKTHNAKASPSKTPNAKAPEPKTPNAEAPQSKPNYYQMMMRKQAGPAAPGSKAVPEGAPNCLANKTFVFTGELESLSRDEAQDLVKRYGAKVTSQPSGKTSYVVVGSDAGPKKLEVIARLGIQTLSEDDLLAMIGASLSSPAGNAAPVPSEPAPEAARHGRSQVAPATVRTETIACPAPSAAAGVPWPDKYAPQTPDELIGNRANYDRLVEWLRAWKPAVSVRGSGGDGPYNAVLISGPPGIGKTTCAHMACRQLGLDVVEMNASDVRSKGALQARVRDLTGNRSIVSFFGSSSAKENKEKTQTRPVLIMDEVDGMSAGDRGGMAELIALLRKTRIPVVCICNDRASPKVRSLANHCLDMRFRRPDARQAAARLAAVAAAEGLALAPNVVDELVAATGADIRQILTLLWGMRVAGASAVDYDAGKAAARAASKDADRGPFDVVPALLGPAYDRLGGARSRVAEAVDMYFVDAALVPLMVFENYARCRPTTARAAPGAYGAHTPRPSYAELHAAAADALSAGDRVDAAIHGAAHAWSLAPLHAVLSCVLPAHLCHGAMAGRVEFASWLGQNSRAGKGARLLGTLARHAHGATAGACRAAFRADYVPVLAGRLLALVRDGRHDDAVAAMDAYCLSREDVDALLELVLDGRADAAAWAKTVPAAAKAAFTRRYNAGARARPYAMGASSGPARRIDYDVDAEGAEGEGAEDGADDAVDDTAEDDNVLTDAMVKVAKPSARRAK